MIIVVDDENRENEGDLICAGEDVTKEDMAFILRHSTGIVCISMDADRLEELKIPMMVAKNEDAKGEHSVVVWGEMRRESFVVVFFSRCGESRLIPWVGGMQVRPLLCRWTHLKV